MSVASTTYDEDEWDLKDILPDPTPADVLRSHLVCADFSQIEARVLPWLAGQLDILEVFRRNEDVYTYTANQIGSTNRQLGKVCVLGLGFGMGPDKFIDTAKVMGRLEITPEFAADTVRNWRQANPEIVQFWYELGDAFTQAVGWSEGTRRMIGGRVTVERGKGAIGILLPSGKRRLIFRNPRLEIEPGQTRPSIVFDGMQQWSKQWGPVRTYGGKLAENITQATARDVMAAAMLKLDERGVDLRLTVHDEIIAITRAAQPQQTLDLVLSTMRSPPPWAHDLPVWAEGYHSKRYRK